MIFTSHYYTPKYKILCFLEISANGTNYSFRVISFQIQPVPQKQGNRHMSALLQVYSMACICAMCVYVYNGFVCTSGFDLKVQTPLHLYENYILSSSLVE